ncbi:MAG: RrF2 family transcriptional regulator [Planctomycetota bacterium]|jgi:Rrf2 family protein
MKYPYFQISKKSGYAIRGLLELALRGDSEPVNVRTLAQSQGIPTRFLEIILNELKQGGFVRSMRGKAGGYLLARGTEEITIGQVICFLEWRFRAAINLGQDQSSR